MTTLTSRTNGDGSKVWVVRWREAGRGSRQRSQTFAREGDAKKFRNAIARSKDLGQLASEVIGSEQTLEDFIVEWWARYATNYLKPGTRASYQATLEKWIVPLLGDLRLREISRETIDTFVGEMRKRGARAPTVNRTLAILQGIMRRAVEWRRLPANPVAGTQRLKHVRATTIDARDPADIAAIRSVLGARDRALVTVLAAEGLRPAEALALTWADVLTTAGKPRARLRVGRALSAGEISTTKSSRERSPELFKPVAAELAELYMANGRPHQAALVFADAAGRHLSLHNWRARTWAAALAKLWPCAVCAGLGKVGEGRRAARCDTCAGTGSARYFRPYDLRHTCATSLLHDGWPVHEVAAHLGHADPGFTLRVYAHVLRDRAYDTPTARSNR